VLNFNKQQPKQHTALSSSEMLEVLNTFKQSHIWVYENLPQVTKDVITNWLTSTVFKFTPMFLMREDALALIKETIFKSEDVRNYIMDLNYRFFTLCNIHTHSDFLESLCINIANGLNIDDSANSLIPDAIRSNLAVSVLADEEKESRLIADKKLISLLKSNKHIVLVFLMLLTLTDKETT
jgi:hypothetical protein